MQKEPLGRATKALRKEDRRKAILDVAERSFFSRGFAETSMSAIAAECGGSKTTLWNHFPSKEALFYAFLDEQIGLFEESLDQALNATEDVEVALGRFARLFLAKIVTPKSCALRRLIGTERQRFPNLAQAFYERGPARARRRLHRYVDAQMAAGRLRAGSPELAARQFFALCQAGTFADMIWHGGDDPSFDIDAEADVAVESFMRIWGPPA